MVPLKPHPILLFGILEQGYARPSETLEVSCLKITIIQKWTLVLIATALLALGGTLGCEDDPVNPDGDTGEPTEIEVTHIIVNPKSPAPGDTIQLTAVIVSNGQNIGDFPDVTWSAGGEGDFLENNEVSVRWKAPGESRLFNISVTVKNAVNSSSKSATVFVGDSQTLVAFEAGQPIYTGPGPTFLYVRTADVAAGVEVYSFDGVNTDDVVPGQELGEGFKISRDGNAAVYQIDDPPAGRLIEPINVYYNNLATGTRVQVTTDRAPEESRRRQQYLAPRISPTGHLMTYQGWRNAMIANDGDSLDVFLWDPVSGVEQAITQTHGFRDRRNWYPSISSDENWVVFVSNRSGIGQWELYGMKLSGTTVVDTAEAAVVRLTDTGGDIASGSSNDVSEPLISWSPGSPVLLVVTNSEDLLQLTFGPSGATTTQVFGIDGKIREFAWSADGLSVAISTGQKIYRIAAGGTEAELVREAPAGDQARDLVWSPDNNYMVYRISRGSQSWLELVEVPGSGEVEEVIVLTPSVAGGNLSGYRGAMSMSPVWTPSDELLYPVFHEGTPAIDILDISGALSG
jgi:Tol biopolymer transport system component